MVTRAASRASAATAGARRRAAVFRLADRSDCVVTTDLVTDGVDFVVGQTEVRRIGHKALAVNLSDLAAMAARRSQPSWHSHCRGHALELAKELFEGMLPLAERFDLAIAGGDTNTWEGPLAIAVTAIGETTERGPLVRSGKPGDRIVVTGEFGGSLAGRHLDFEPRVAEALLLHQRHELHAGIDCSDGLSLDLSRLCAESGCGAVIDIDRVPISAAAYTVASSGLVRLGDSSAEGGEAGVHSITPLNRALTDGEDFELILTVPPIEAARMIAEQPLSSVRVTDIGEFISQRRPVATQLARHRDKA